MLTYGIAFIIASVVLLVVTLSMRKQYMLFEDDGSLCTATVIDAKTVILKVNGTKQRVYRLVVNYSIDGLDYTRELKTTQEGIVDVVGTEMPIRYRLSDPNTILSGDGTKQKKLIRNMIIITAAVFVAGVVLMFL